MDSDEHSSYSNFEIGDIVGESEYIVPPGRPPWVGVVVYVDKDYYELGSQAGEFEDLVAVHWFKPSAVESLPASVIRIIQKARKKRKKNLDTI